MFLLQHMLTTGIVIGLLSLSCTHDSGMNSAWPSVDGENSPLLKLSVTQKESAEGVYIEINFDIPLAGHVLFKVRNSVGHTIDILIDRDMEAGSHIAEWRSANVLENRMADGFYIYDIEYSGPTENLRAYKILYIKFSSD